MQEDSDSGGFGWTELKHPEKLFERMEKESGQRSDPTPTENLSGREDLPDTGVSLSSSLKKRITCAQLQKPP